MLNLVPPVAPDSDRQASAEALRSAVRLFREAGSQGLTRDSLAKALRKSTRHANRVLRLLMDQGATFEKERQNRSGVSIIVHRMVAGPAWDEAISPQALTALKVAVDALDQVGTEIWTDHLKTVESLVGHQLTTRDRILFQSLSERVKARGTITDPQTLDPHVLREVLQALGAPNGPVQLELTYAPPGRPSWSQAVFPYTLTHDAFGGGAFLLVWDPAKKRAIHLRLNRIEQAKALRVPAIFLDEAPLQHAEHFQIGGWFERTPAFPVLVKVTGRAWAQALLESPPALPDISVEDVGEGVLIRFLATEPYAPARWILQFGGDAKVIKPALVQDTVKQRLQEALALYARS